jgi:hypothetical protein
VLSALCYKQCYCCRRIAAAVAQAAKSAAVCQANLSGGSCWCVSCTHGFACLVCQHRQLCGRFKLQALLSLLSWHAFLACLSHRHRTTSHAQLWMLFVASLLEAAACQFNCNVCTFCRPICATNWGCCCLLCCRTKAQRWSAASVMWDGRQD